MRPLAVEPSTNMESLASEALQRLITFVVKLELMG
jgi:hypothetical protein